MPGAGTDRTKDWSAPQAPVIVLVEPQLGENIGAAARAMANFGLSRLRLVAPRPSWPNPKASMMAAGALIVIDTDTSPRSMPEKSVCMSSRVSTATPSLPTSPRERA